jgi:hypothetical protein
VSGRLVTARARCRAMAPSLTAVFFAGGEAMLLTPFWAGSAHVVQLGAIGVENARRPFRDRRAETLPHFAREGADEHQFMHERAVEEGLDAEVVRVDRAAQIVDGDLQLGGKFVLGDVVGCRKGGGEHGGRCAFSASISPGHRRPAIMTQPDHSLSRPSTVAGYVWSPAAGGLMHGLLCSHRCHR